MVAPLVGPVALADLSWRCMSASWTRTWWWRGIVWTTATAAALTIAWQTKVGRSLALIPRHGVHVGDLAAFAVSYTWAALLTTRRPTGAVTLYTELPEAVPPPDKG